MQSNPKFTYLAAAALAASVIAVPTGVGAPSASAQGRHIPVTGTLAGFAPPTINVTAGEVVHIALTSPDVGHDLTIPTAGNFQVVAGRAATVAGVLTAPAAAGSFPFLCTVNGHDNMRGTLVVAAAGAPPPVVTPPVVTPPVVTPPVTRAHIKMLSPRRGQVRTRVTIKGTGFGTRGKVKFGKVAARARSWTARKIVVRVPVRVSARRVLVTVTPRGGKPSNAVRFRLTR